MSFFMEFHAKAEDVPSVMAQFIGIPDPVKDYVTAATANVQGLVHVKANGHLAGPGRVNEGSDAGISVRPITVATAAPPK